MLESLTHMLYELPKKVVSYATLEQLGIDSCGRGKLFLVSSTDSLNLATKGLDANGIKQYAVNGIDKVETYIRTKDYVMNCDPSFVSAKVQPLTDTAQKVVDYAIQHAMENGKEIPFTSNPILDALIMGSAMLGIGVGGGYLLRKKGINLFHSYDDI